MKPVYHIVVHPHIETSRVNKKILKAFEGKEGIETRYLYKEYPQWNIDIEREKKSLINAEIIVVQTPFYWYSTPGLFKEWQDKVLEYGFAYGDGGDKLKNKLFQVLLTAFGPEEAYKKDGYNRFTIRELLAPLEQTAYLCKLTYLEPLALLGVAKKTDEEIEAFTSLVSEKIEAIRKS